MALVLRMVLWVFGLWSFFIAILLGAMVLTGCGPHHAPLTPPQQDAVRAAEVGWRAAGLPEPGKCLQKVAVRRGDCAGNNSCLLHEGQWVVVLDATNNDRAATVHECMHALYACTLPRIHWSDPYDRYHTNKRVWAPNQGSAEMLSPR